MGCAVEEEAPDFSGAIESFQVLRALLFADVRGDLLPRERARINPDIVSNIEKGQQLTAARSSKRSASATCYSIVWHASLTTTTCSSVPLLLSPLFPVEQRFPSEIAGEKLTTYIDSMSTPSSSPWSAVRPSHCPAD